MEFLRNRAENAFSKCVQKAANDYVFQNGNTHKWMQMQIIIETDLKMNSTKLWNPTQNARKSHKKREFPKHVETERKPNCLKISRKNKGKTQNVGKVRFTANFRNSQNWKMKNARVYFCFKGVS